MADQPLPGLSNTPALGFGSIVMDSMAAHETIGESQ